MALVGQKQDVFVPKSEEGWEFDELQLESPSLRWIWSQTSPLSWLTTWEGYFAKRLMTSFSNLNCITEDLLTVSLPTFQ